MSLDAIFTLELLLTVAVIVIMWAGAIYLSLYDRRGQRETSRRVRTGDVPAGTARDEPTDGAPERVTQSPDKGPRPVRSQMTLMRPDFSYLLERDFRS